jgi:hypothetical protein
MSNIEELFDVHQSKLNKSALFADKITALFILIIIFFGIFILETRILFNIDVHEWNIEKCNPKYLFFSGFIRRNENSTSFESTQDNLVECIAQYSRKSGNNFEKRMNDENDKNINEINNDLENRINNRNIALGEKGKKRYDNEKSIALRTSIINQKNNSRMESLQVQILEMNKVLSDFKEYLHSYLTYAMMNFAVKFKKQQTVEMSIPADKATTCGNYSSNDCNKQETCIYAKIGDEDVACVKKSTFFRDQSNKINSIVKTSFNGNKL